MHFPIVNVDVNEPYIQFDDVDYGKLHARPPCSMPPLHKLKSFFSIPAAQKSDFLCMVLCGFFFVNTVTVCLTFVSYSSANFINRLS